MQPDRLKRGVTPGRSALSLLDYLLGGFLLVALLASGRLRHQHHRDMLRFFIFQGLVLLVSFYLSALFFQALADGLGFTSVSDTAALPLLILMFGLMGLVMTPLTAFFTRTIEFQADLFAIYSPVTPIPLSVLWQS